jgi:uncharacterized protein (DUF1697 family)
VALLRSVNVAGHGKLKMDTLRAIFEELGYTDVATYIQSGNVIFTSRAKVLAGPIEAGIRAATGMEATLALRTSSQLRKILEGNPFTSADPAKLHVGFAATAPRAVLVKGLDLARFGPEQASITGSELYLHLPGGMARAKLPDYLGRQLKVPITIRNWNTVTKLVELTGS